PRNQVMSNRRVMSDKFARRVIRISRPSQTAKSSSRVIKAGRGASGDWTKTLSSAALATTRKVPSRRIGMGGNGGGGARETRDPLGAIGSRVEPCTGAAREHLRCADLVRSEPVADLSGIGRN